MSRRFKKMQFLVISLAIGFTGLSLVLFSKAATPAVSLEPESGTLSTAAAKRSDATASASQAVKFGSGSSGVPAQCASGGAYLWANLAPCGWPGPTNTGYDASACPSGLTNVGSSKTTHITYGTANTIISCQNITGMVDITAQNVTIKNSKITGDGGGAGGTGVININDGASATVDHVEINGSLHTHACIWDEGIKGTTLTYSMVAQNVNCYGVNDGIFSWWWSTDKNLGAGSDFIIQDSYLHDFTENAANGHIDGYQTEGAQNGTIQHNTFKVLRAAGDVTVSGAGLDSAIALWDDWNQNSEGGKNTTNITVNNNLISSGGFAFYAEDYSPKVDGAGNGSGGNTLTDVHFTNNKLSTIYNQCVGDFGVWFYRGSWTPYYGGPTDGWNKGGSSASGNVVLETGAQMNSGNNSGLPSGCG